MAEAQASLPNVEAPAAAAAPVVPAAAALEQQPARRAKPARQQAAPAKRPGMIEIPQNAFKARIQREAAVLVKRQLGVTLEEAEKIVKAGGAHPGGDGKTSVQATADAALRQENERLKKDRDRRERETNDRVKKADKAVRRANDRAITAEMRAEARLSGITDPDFVDKAVNLLARAALQDENVDPHKFFGELKKSHPGLYTTIEAPAPVAAPAAVPVVAASSVPAESPAQGEVRPQPAAAGAPAPGVNAEALSDADFAKHQRSYGFVPGM